MIFSALRIADQDQSIQMIKDIRKHGVDVAKVDDLKQSALFYTARDGKYQLCQYFIKEQVDVNLIDYYGQNAIFYAVKYGHLDVVKLLKDNGS